MPIFSKWYGEGFYPLTWNLTTETYIETIPTTLQECNICHGLIGTIRDHFEWHWNQGWRPDVTDFG